MLRTLIAITMCQALSTCMYFLNGNFILLLSKSVNQHHAVQDASCPFSLIMDSEIFFFIGLHWVFAVVHGRGFSINSLAHGLSCPMACGIFVP